MVDISNIKELLTRSAELRLNNKLEKALELITSNIEMFQDEKQAFTELGVVHLELKNYDLALNALTRALELDPEDISSLTLLGKVYCQKENYKQAILAWSKVSDLDPRNVQIMKLLGELYFDIGEYYKAQEVLNNYLKYEKDKEVFSLLAHLYQKMGNTVETWNTLMQAEEFFPEDVDIILQIGAYYYDIENFKRAREYFSKALELDSDNQVAYFQLGKTYEQLNDTYNAIESYSKVIEIDPDHALAFYHLGKIYASTANIEQATSCYTECLRIDPSFDEASIDLASLKWAAKEYDTALKILHDALYYSKKDTDIYNMIAGIYEDMGKMVKAKEFSEKANKILNED